MAAAIALRDDCDGGRCATGEAVGGRRSGAAAAGAGGDL